MTIEIIYWDSDAFLGWLQEEPGKVELCKGTLERAQVAEGRPAHPQGKGGDAPKVLPTFYFRVRNVTRTVAELAQDVVWHHSVKPKDAIHVATALDAKAPAFETFDDDLLKKSGLIGTPPLVIRRPIPPKQPSLFNEKAASRPPETRR